MTPIKKAKRPARSRPALRFLTAIGIVTLLNVALLASVRIEPPVQKVRHRTWPRVYLLPVDEAPSSPAQASLQAWLDLLDPTILSLPSETRGFSTVRHGEFVRPLSPPPLWPIAIPRSGAPELSAPALTAANDSLVDGMARLRATAPPELPLRGRFTKPTLPAGIYWTRPTGEIIPTAPQLELPEALNAASVTRPTLLSGLVTDVGIRAMVETSCGDRRLDLLALSAFRRWLGRDAQKLPADAAPDKEGAITVAVQWRYAAGITLSQPPMDATLWNGEEWRDLHWR